MRHFVYLVRCGDGTLYTGYSTDVTRRVATHNAGKGAKYTRARLPVELVGQWEYPSRGAALSAEHRIRRLSRQAKLTLAMQVEPRGPSMGLDAIPQDPTSEANTRSPSTPSMRTHTH